MSLRVPYCYEHVFIPGDGARPIETITYNQCYGVPKYGVAPSMGPEQLHEYTQVLVRGSEVDDIGEGYYVGDEMMLLGLYKESRERERNRQLNHHIEGI
jgi:hypothetical protein